MIQHVEMRCAISSNTLVHKISNPYALFIFAVVLYGVTGGFVDGSIVRLARLLVGVALLDSPGFFTARF